MKILSTLLLVLSLSVPALAAEKPVSTPLAFQIDAAAAPESGANLARLVEPGNSAGVPVGQWIGFDFGKSVTLTRMTIVNGWAAPESFRQHPRLKTVLLEFADGSRQSVTLKDTSEPQSVALKGGGKGVKLTVKDVYPGSEGETPYVSGVSFEGFDPSQRQVTLTGRFEGCVQSRSSSSWSGEEAPLYYCSRFRADDGRLFGCMDDLCFHPKEMVNVRLKVTGVVKEGDVLQVLEAAPAR